VLKKIFFLTKLFINFLLLKQRNTQNFVVHVAELAGYLVCLGTPFGSQCDSWRFIHWNSYVKLRWLGGWKEPTWERRIQKFLFLW